MPQIDADRFLRDLNELRQIGAYKTGVHRPTYSPEDMESRRWLMERMAEIGLDPAIDGIGNVYGRHNGLGPHLLVGSHIETQKFAGMAGWRTRRRRRARSGTGRAAGGRGGLC